MTDAVARPIGPRRGAGRRPGVPDDRWRRRSPSSPASGGSTRTPAGWRRCCSESVGPLPSWEEVIADGLGQLTRTFGTAPARAGRGRCGPWRERQRDVMAANRFGIPAQVHEECLTGLAAWRATIYPSPLCWAASFDPDARRADGRPDRAARCGSLGIHQGLAPVLDVVRDLRWGRVEETLGEDPFLVGLDRQRLRPRPRERRRRRHAQALPRLLRIAGGPQPGAGVDGTAGARRRDPAAVRDGAAGGRPLGDELLHRHRRRAGGRRPGAADRPCCATSSGFTGTVASDYFSVAFLQTLHRRRGRPRRGRRAGPRGRHRRRAAVDRTRSASRCSRRVVGRPGRREDRRPGARRGCCGRSASSACSTRAGRRREPGDVDLDDTGVARARSRAGPTFGRAARQRRQPAAGRRARRSPSSARAPTRREAMLGCYSFPMHVLVHHPGVDDGAGDPHRPRRARRDLRRHLRARLPGPRRRRRRHRGRGRRGGGRRGLRRRCSATRPGSSARARPARAATSPTCGSPAGRRSCSRRCSPPVRRSSSCCSSAVRTT